jgi:hypothetical protein
LSNKSFIMQPKDLIAKPPMQNTKKLPIEKSEFMIRPRNVGIRSINIGNGLFILAILIDSFIFLKVFDY